jgi:predicted nucleotidyltransferase
MSKVKQALEELAERFGLKIIYGFGSRGREALEFVNGDRLRLDPTPSDLDVGVKPAGTVTVSEKVDLALRLEELFGVPRVDLIVLPEVSTFLALEIVSGELLFAEDPHYEAEYQLYTMRKAAELAPYREMKKRMVLGLE